MNAFPNKVHVHVHTYPKKKDGALPRAYVVFFVFLQPAIAQGACEGSAPSMHGLSWPQCRHAYQGKSKEEYLGASTWGRLNATRCDTYKDMTAS